MRRSKGNVEATDATADLALAAQIARDNPKVLKEIKRARLERQRHPDRVISLFTMMAKIEEKLAGFDKKIPFGFIKPEKITRALLRCGRTFDIKGVDGQDGIFMSFFTFKDFRDESKPLTGRGLPKAEVLPVDEFLRKVRMIFSQAKATCMIFVYDQDGALLGFCTTQKIMDTVKHYYRFPKIQD